ncbi:tryptophan--tRNA ligase [Candidatus Woesearchaeota archaeon]|nr:tryptophan--tRNA ligase [Candidatus Woesearchaeota archaeon]
MEVGKSEKDYIVTPWEVKGDVDYNKLIQEFGTKPITNKLLKRIEKHAGKVHHFLTRKIFFSHRDMDFILDQYEKGNKFALYTGRGPSGTTHIGHLIPWIFTKWLQDKFGVELYFQIVDDEKFLVKDLTLEQTTAYGYDNALDLIALGFDPKKTKIIINTEYSKTLYRIALKIAKKITFSQARAVFGFTNESNIGIIFYTSMQGAPCFLPSVLKKKNVPVLIPAAIDQDAYWRGIARDVAPKLGYYKPAQLHCRFLPGLGGISEDGKMSSSQAHTTIWTTDTPEQVKKKIMKYAFSGGQDTIENHRKHGGNPDIDVSYQWLTFFEEDDKKLEKIYHDYKSGKLLTGELKQILIDKLNKFLANHQKKREEAKKNIEKFMLRD